MVFTEVFLLHSRYPLSQRNFASQQFSAFCIIFWDIFDNHASPYSIIQCSLDFCFLLVLSVFHSIIIFGILSFPILFKCPNHLNHLSHLSFVTLIASMTLFWTFIIFLIFRFLIFSFLDLLAASPPPDLCTILHDTVYNWFYQYLSFT